MAGGKGPNCHFFTLEDRFGYPVPLFDCFNEARAYVFLKQQGYIDIAFLKTGGKKPKKVPDLLAKGTSSFWRQNASATRTTKLSTS
jgi:hypothetical protein